MPLILLRGINSVRSYISMATAQMIGMAAIVFLMAIHTEPLAAATFITAAI
jgi:hypothetical protein